MSESAFQYDVKMTDFHQHVDDRTMLNPNIDGIEAY